MTEPTPGRVYVSDLDGTLLRGDATLSPFAHEGLCRLLGHGVHFTVATARSAASIRSIMAGVPLTLPVVEFSGAMVTDLGTGERLHIAEIASDVVGAMADVAARAGLCPFVSCLEEGTERLYHGRAANRATAWYLADRARMGDRRLRQVEDVAATARRGVVCMTVMGDEDETSAVAAALRDEHGTALRVHHFPNDYDPGSWWVTAQDGRSDKGTATRLLIERLALTGHEVVAFGDYGWDLALFAAADHSVAVANASDEIRAAATEVIGSNEDDAVVRWMLAAEGLPVPRDRHSPAG